MGAINAPVAQLDRASGYEAGNQICEILPEPTQPAKKQQLVAKLGKPFFSFLFAFPLQFAEICGDLYYVFTTAGGHCFASTIFHSKHSTAYRGFLLLSTNWGICF